MALIGDMPSLALEERGGREIYTVMEAWKSRPYTICPHRSCSAESYYQLQLLVQ